MSTRRHELVVIGAGLAGLSAAERLRAADPVVVEKLDQIGGACRTHRVGDFHFDMTGHLLHLRDPEVTELVETHLPDAFVTAERRSFIYSKGVRTAYPFQANTHGLPPEVIKECLLGFVSTLSDPLDPERASRELSFHAWCERTFGAGISRHFMWPYNEKLWCRDLREMSCEWVSWAVPKPTLEQVIDGALGIGGQRLGYNAVFRYPRAGGISVLPEMLAGRLGDVRTGRGVVRIDAARREVLLTDGDRLGYEKLVSTMPLPELLAVSEGLPAEVTAPGPSLRSVQVVNFSLGIDRADVSDAHWIYFPEPEYPFYRVGFPSNFSPGAAPDGTSSMYVELSRPSGRPVDVEALRAEAIAGLERCGILHPGDRIIAEDRVILDPAYVIFDPYRQRHLDTVLAALRRYGIVSCGRFGGWDYLSMEGAILAGWEAARKIESGG